jgi:hypothetical protein
MRAIARNTARGLVLTLMAAVFACADTHDDVIEVVTSMAGALTEVNMAKFMSAFSKDYPDYGTMETGVTALMKQAEVSSSITPLAEDGDDQARKIDLDWVLDVRSLEQDGPIVHRRQVVHCELRREKKRWKIVALSPLDFFAPAPLGR